jgi:hypothetical protein
MSDASPTTMPDEMRPSTIEVPSVPALKFTKPSCMTVGQPGQVGRNLGGRQPRSSRRASRAGSGAGNQLSSTVPSAAMVASPTPAAEVAVHQGTD